MVESELKEAEHELMCVKETIIIMAEEMAYILGKIFRYNTKFVGV